MTDYAVAIDLGNPNTSHTQVVDLVGEDKRVLDVGCWSGDLGRVLMSRRCTVSGLEIDPEAAALAAQVLHRVVVADLDTAPLSSHFEAGSFDVVVFADVLEHLKDPAAVLRDAQQLLAPGGRVVISLPNVSHGSVRLHLLQGRWETTDTGLLDRTHIRFYTRTGLLDLLQEAGYVAEDLRGTLADPLSVEVGVDGESLPEDVVEWVRNQPDALVYQFQVSARPRTEADTVVAQPRLTEATALDVVRRRDEHTTAYEQRRRDALAMKDHVLGLQATATSAEFRAEKLYTRVKALRERLDVRNRQIKRLQRRVGRLEAELAAVRQSGLRTRAKRAARRLLG